MNVNDFSETSLSLLQRLKNQPVDEESWTDFVSRYEPRILAWCRKWGLQNADAFDVTQNVLVKIAKHMSRFEYREGGGFRKWLRKVTYHAWCDHLNNHKWSGAGGDAIRAVFESVEARDNLLDLIEQEYNEQIFADAKQIVKTRVEPHVWQAFELMTHEGKSATEVSELLNIASGNAYVCKGRVQNMLAEEISRMEDLTVQ